MHEIEKNNALPHSAAGESIELNRAALPKIVHPITTSQIKETFINYFTERGYLKIDAAPLSAKNDPTLLFVNSGMAPLKSYFTGENAPPHAKACNIQQCVRTNDIESIGDDYHLSLFEMMGNWTFGTLDKLEAISNAFNLVRDAFALNDRRLVATYYIQDSSIEGVPTDFEAKQIWNGLGLPEENIYGLGAKDNFWGPAGTSGPCGSCTELFIDRGEQYGQSPDEGPDAESGRYIEIWNPGVFMQWDKNEQGEMLSLSSPSLDAGAGVERWAMILQGVDSVYEIDSIRPIIDDVVAGTDLTYKDKAARIITDHIRTSSILLSQDLTPSNKQEGYILRRLIRRAVVQAKQNDIPFENLYDAADRTLTVFADTMSVTEELRQGVRERLQKEISGFCKTLAAGEKRLSHMLSANNGTLSAEDAFLLKETFGLPLEIVRDLTAPMGVLIDDEEYRKAETLHRNRSNGGRK